MKKTRPIASHLRTRLTAPLMGTPLNVKERDQQARPGSPRPGRRPSLYAAIEDAKREIELKNIASLLR